MIPTTIVNIVQDIAKQILKKSSHNSQKEMIAMLNKYIPYTYLQTKIVQVINSLLIIDFSK